MWRAALAAEAYVYLPSGVTQDVRYLDQADIIPNPNFGDSLGRRILRFSKSGWNRVRMRVRMNTVGQADGIVELSINDTHYAFSNLVFRETDDVQVTSLYFSTFFGGKRPFATVNDTHVDFRKFKVVSKAMLQSIVQ
jgi:hypothetical protein